MQMEETDTHSSSAHFCLSIRIGNCYLALVILQLALGVSLFVTLSYGLIITAAIIQIWIGFFIGLDLLIKYFSEEQNFFKTKENFVDLFVLGVLVCCIAASQINFTKFLYYNEDSFVSALCVAVRYCCQLLRLICLFKSSREVYLMHKLSDEIDLNLMADSSLNENENMM